MLDMNFFAVYKRAKSKNSKFKIFLIVLVVVVLLLNALLIGGGLYVFDNIEKDIASMHSYINDPATQQAIRDAERIKQEADLTAQYLNLLKSVDYKFEQLDFINTDLLDHIRALTPDNTVFTSAQITGININLLCESSDPTGAMDMYHAFRESPLFSNVILSGITINEDVSIFTINCLFVVEGGDEA